MQLRTHTVRRYDLWLVGSTCLAIAFFLVVAFRLVPVSTSVERIGNLQYVQDTDETLTFENVFNVQPERWQSVSNPVNLGMNHVPFWFSFTLPPTPDNLGAFLVEVRYPLLDSIEVAFYEPGSTEPRITYSGGDAQTFSSRPVSHESLLFPVPASQEGLQAIARVKTGGTIRLPIRLWEEKEFVEHTSKQNLFMGIFFGFLLAMGISNLFLFLTTRNRTFLMYSGYVFSLTLTLGAIHGFAYAHIWPNQVWFQGRAVAIFANAAIMFALIFSRMLLQVSEHSRRADHLLKVLSALFAVNILISLILPYTYLIRIFLLLLSAVVLITLALGIWLALKGVVVARYYSFAWAFLLFSGFTASLDNLNLLPFDIPSNYLLMLGAAVETLILALVLAISYSHNREEMYDAQEKALAQEKAALAAKEDLIAVQTRHQEELQYKVEERTLELEIALRELSDANRELETLNSIDSMTGIRNRRHFDKRLMAEGRRSRREQTPLSLAMLDIDHFKRINDEFGHTVGDSCITHVAKQLQSLLRRPTDDVCRYGGEEFAIILPNTDLSGAEQVVESMREAIESTPVEVDGESISMTISAGVSTTVVAYEEHELALLKHADKQLYAAKQAGRNQVKAENLPG